MNASPTGAETPTVAFLGTGIMGSAMAVNAARAGLRVRAWSRPLADAERLAPEGIEVRPTAAAAVDGADLVLTVVPDAAAVETFAEGPDGFLDALGPEAIWIQSSTVGVAPADRLIELATAHGATIVDAPLLGSREPAERAELIMLASGEESAIDRCEPLFTTISRRTVRLGRAGNGSRMKMVTNGWIMSSVAGVAEAMALAKGLGLDGSGFLEAITGTGFDMGYAQTKGRMMLSGEYPAQMRLANGAKDARLAAAAHHEAGLQGRLVGAAAALMERGCELGHVDEDMAAAFFAALEPGRPAS
ncbi:MAG TPA: NAD(P)-dependent oxidoreductase [Solirubrobacterales bacterium]|nr:NAD(P)-dependent oxidoreductase [Solirubrobacterales bacterium]